MKFLVSDGKIDKALATTIETIDRGHSILEKNRPETFDLSNSTDRAKLNTGNIFIIPTIFIFLNHRFSYFYNLRAITCQCNFAPTSNSRKFKKYFKSTWRPFAFEKYRICRIILSVKFEIYWQWAWTRVRGFVSDRKPKIEKTLRK